MEPRTLDPMERSNEAIDEIKKRSEAETAAINWDQFDTSAEDVKKKVVKFLWEGFIPLGRLCYNHGIEGIGKSSIWYSIIAQLTTGMIKGEFQGKPMNVAIINPEDGNETGVKPRLEANGADMSRVRIWKNIQNPDTKRPEVLNLNTDYGMDFFRYAVEKNDIKFVLIDNTGATFKIKDSNADQAIVNALTQIADLAIQKNITVMLLGHDNKGEHFSSRNMLSGSHKLAATPRAVYHTLEDRENSRVGLALYKTNEFSKRDVGAMVYELYGYEFVDDDGDSGVIGAAQFIEETEQSGEAWAHSILTKRAKELASARAATKQANSDDAVKPKCVDWVRAWMVQNPDGTTKEELVKISEESWGKDNGYGPASITNAFKELELQSKSVEVSGRGRGRPPTRRFFSPEQLVEATKYVMENPATLAQSEPQGSGGGLRKALTDGVFGDLWT